MEGVVVSVDECVNVDWGYGALLIAVEKITVLEGEGKS